MSIVTARRIIGAGDHVMVYENFQKINPIVMVAGARFQNRFGEFRHDDLIGMPYGTKVKGRGKDGGWVLLLSPSPELWTAALSHRTQILYHADISLILLWLRVRPGAVVVESGTGSGSLSHGFVRSVAPHGHLHTFEFNADRVEKARADFKANGVDHLVTVRHRNVCARGFPLIEGGVDAVFLDLPTPWEVVESSKNILVAGGHFCSFSPCIEQVQRTCLALSARKFTDIRTVECLIRTYELVSVSQTIPDFGLSTDTQSSSPSGDDGNKRRNDDIDDADDKNCDTSNKRARVDVSPSVVTSSSSSSSLSSTDSNIETKTPMVATSDDTKAIITSAATPSSSSSSSSGQSRRGNGKGGRRATADTSLAATTLGRPFQLMRGHTGWLTFAVRSVD